MGAAAALCCCGVGLGRRTGFNHAEAIKRKSKSELRRESAALINFGFVCLINLLIARTSIPVSRTAPTGLSAANINPDKPPVCSQLHAAAAAAVVHAR